MIGKEQMSNVSIQINEQIIERYTSQGLSLEFLGSVLFILIALYEEKFELLDSFDDRNKQRRVMLLYQMLHRKEFLEQGEDDSIYTLTERGVEFVNFIKSFDETDSKSNRGSSEGFDSSQRGNSGSEQESSGAGGTKAEDSREVAEWIEEWIKLFPPQKIDGRYLRTNKHDCADRMRWFIKQYGYGKDIIFRATKLYLDSQEASSDGHKFSRNSSYFIFKGRTKAERSSDLATWCTRVENGEEEREVMQRDVI